MAESSSQEEERIALLAEDTDMDHKDNIEHAEIVPATDAKRRHGDRALALIGDERVVLTNDDNKRIRRKTDLRILPILIWVYFLQGEFKHRRHLDLAH